MLGFVNKNSTWLKSTRVGQERSGDIAEEAASAKHGCAHQHGPPVKLQDIQSVWRSTNKEFKKEKKRCESVPKEPPH